MHGENLLLSPPIIWGGGALCLLAVRLQTLGHFLQYHTGTLQKTSRVQQEEKAQVLSCYSHRAPCQGLSSLLHRNSGNSVRLYFSGLQNHCIVNGGVCFLVLGQARSILRCLYLFGKTKCLTPVLAFFSNIPSGLGCHCSFKLSPINECKMSYYLFAM